MPDSATGGALSGAASGAATGTAILPGWGTAIGAVVGGIGGYLSASGTSDAQATQNKAAAQAAAAQSAQSFLNYLSSRGVNVQQLIANDPRGADFWTGQYGVAKSQGVKDDFNTWFVKAIQAAPTDQIWSVIANPAAGGAAQNTTLPAWAVDANGNPLQPAILQQLVQTSNAASTASKAAQQQAIAQQWLAGPGANLQSVWDSASPEDKAQYGSLQNFVLADFNANATADQKTSITTAAASAPGAAGASPGSAGIGSNLTLDPAIAALIPQATKTLGNVFDGTLLAQTNSALVPVAAARDAGVAAQLAKINELRGLSGNLLNTELGGIADVNAARTAGAGGIFDATVAGAGSMRAAAEDAAQKVHDANVDKLAELLGVRREAAQQIYDATAQGAAGVRDARTAGAQGIYGAESLKADTYAQSAEQALSRVLAQQSAERLRQGFTGGSSGADITRARVTADALQQGAGARAQAGVNLAGRLSDAGVGYAGDIGNAGIGRATSLGAAADSDAQAQLQAAVDLARSLGLAGTNYAGTVAGAGTTRATTLASAGEQNAIATLQAKVADATRRLTYLTSDADIAKANADLANAQDALAALTNNQNRAVGAITSPFQLAGADLSLKTNLTDQQYSDLDALLKRLSAFSTTPAGGPSLTTSNPGAVLNGSQIAGGALSGLGSSIGNLSSNSSLADLIKSLTAPSGGAGAATATPTGSGLLSSGNYLSGSSVFQAPKGPG